MLQRLKMSIEERKHLHSLQESVRPEIPGTCFATSLLSGGGTEYVCRVLCLQAISSLEGEVKELELQSSHALDAVLSADRLFFLIPFLCCLCLPESDSFPPGCYQLFWRCGQASAGFALQCPHPQAKHSDGWCAECFSCCQSPHDPPPLHCPFRTH